MASGQTGVINKSAVVGVGVSRSKAISNLSLGKDQLEKCRRTGREAQSQPRKPEDKTVSSRQASHKAVVVCSTLLLDSVYGVYTGSTSLLCSPRREMNIFNHAWNASRCSNRCNQRKRNVKNACPPLCQTHI